MHGVQYYVSIWIKWRVGHKNGSGGVGDQKRNIYRYNTITALPWHNIVCYVCYRRGIGTDVKKRVPIKILSFVWCSNCVTEKCAIHISSYEIDYRIFSFLNPDDLCILDKVIWLKKSSYKKGLYMFINSSQHFHNKVHGTNVLCFFSIIIINY